MTEEKTIKPCPECGNTINNSKLMERFEVPFRCKTCGSLKFTVQALNGVVFLWPKPAVGQVGSIIIPEQAKESLKSSIGIVLSSGKGCKQKTTQKYIHSELEQGDMVLYDKSIPWRMSIPTDDGKEYEVEMMQVLDVNAIIVDGDDSGIEC